MEIGYHIAEKYTGRGYATEAVRAFLPVIMKQLETSVIYGLVMLKILHRKKFWRIASLFCRSVAQIITRALLLKSAGTGTTDNFSSALSINDIIGECLINE
ncbi:MAG: GNAT family N-acetyltransferase [Alkalibacterium sp.]|nr:GNAT family N-acetyltransferase [Alkalibacterium sp.]